MPKGYLFSVDGKITSVSFKSGKTCDDITPSILGKEYRDEPSLYMKAIPEDLFLMMHEDNDFFENYQKSPLEVNQALRKYFPNSPFKGNVLLVRLDDDDLIVGGWSHSILKKFKMGYVDDLGVNEPVVISRKDVLKIKDKPVTKKKVKPVPVPTPFAKKCKECGLVKKYLHAEQCILERTRLAIEKVNDLLSANPEVSEYLKGSCADVLAMECVSWSKFTKFSALRKKGLNLISLQWINFHLDHFHSESDLGKRTILDGIISVMYCFDRNSRFDFSLEECPDCRECENRSGNQTKIDPEECQEIRKKGFKAITRWLDHLEFGNVKKFARMKTMIFPHLTLHVFSQLISQLKRGVEKRTPVEKECIEPIIIGMIFYWATLVIEEYEFSRMMTEVDQALFG